MWKKFVAKSWNAIASMIYDIYFINWLHIAMWKHISYLQYAIWLFLYISLASVVTVEQYTIFLDA